MSQKKIQEQSLSRSKTEAFVEECHYTTLVRFERHGGPRNGATRYQGTAKNRVPDLKKAAAQLACNVPRLQAHAHEEILALAC